MNRQILKLHSAVCLCAIAQTDWRKKRCFACSTGLTTAAGLSGPWHYMMSVCSAQTH